MLAALDPSLVERRVVALDTPFTLVPGLEAELFAVPGKVPLYLEGERVETIESEQTVGVALRAGGTRAFYIPGCARLTGRLRERLLDADLLLFDGTLWDDAEMIRARLGAKTGRRMGHMPVSGPDGSIAVLAGLGIRRRIFVHLNNSNPLVDPASAQRAEAEAAGWEIAHDGMEIAP